MELTINDEFSNWESLINTVDKSDIPLEFVNSVNLEFMYPEEGKDSLSIDVTKFRDIGYTSELIEDIVNETLNEFYTNIKAIDFFVDVEYVATTAQAHTNKFLKGLE